MSREKIPGSSPDAFFDMALRREINDFADLPVDFYLEGFKKAREYTGLTDQSTVLDIGCSNGRFIIEAARATETNAALIGLDIDSEAYRHFPPPHTAESRFSFIQGRGESVPLAANSVQVAMAHNVLFRSNEASAILREMQRVVEPEGLLMVSTNGRGHAFWRHTFERLVALELKRGTSLDLIPPKPPAENCYLEDIPEMIAEVGDLSVIDTSVVQYCQAKITPDRLEDYLTSIKLTANRTDISPQMHHAWRRLVDAHARSFILDHMRKNGDGNPYFVDVVHRGMFVMRNNKSAP